MLKIILSVILSVFSSYVFSAGKAFVMNGTHDTLHIEYRTCTFLDKKRICTDKKIKTLGIAQYWSLENTDSHTVIITKLNVSNLVTTYPDIDDWSNIPSKEWPYVYTCNVNVYPLAISVFANEIFCLNVFGK